MNQAGADGRYRLILGDCLDRMGELPDGSVDLIAADLPYGVTNCRWDSVIPFEPLWDHYRRVLKPRGAVVLTASQPFTSMLVMSNRKWFRYSLVWEKTRPTQSINANRRPLQAHEDILVFAPGPMTYHPQKTPARLRVESERTVKAHPTFLRGPVTRKFDNGGLAYPRSVFLFANPNHANVHPTQKPVPLFEYLIRTYSDPGDVVLDSCMGSGTTGVACLNTGRYGIGIEKDPDIFATAERRLAAESARFPLLAAVP